MAASVGAATFVPYGGCSSWPSIQSSRVISGSRRRSSRVVRSPEEVMPASASRFACQGTVATAQSTRFPSLRSWSSRISSRGIVSWRGFQYGVSFEPSAMFASLPGADGCRSIVTKGGSPRVPVAWRSCRTLWSVAFALTDAQQRLLDETRASARNGLPEAPAGDGPEVSTRRLVRSLADVGVLGRLFPATAGGARPEPSVSALDLCLVREALAQESTEAETALAMQGLGGYPILQSGTPALIERYVPPIARGEAIGAFALTEAEHGTDAGSIELRAERDGEGWRLTGSKTWISNAPFADVIALFARTTPDAGSKGVTAFVLPGDTPGVAGRSLELVSPHPIGTLELDGAFVPA